MMMSRLVIYIAILSMCILAYRPPAAADQITGIVYEDTNRNLQRDRGEPGVPNVIVSNQHDVTTTDSRGRYTLPVLDEMIVFITKPSGYTVPVNDQNLPQFYYIHQPIGSPKLEFPGIEPTGHLPRRLNFPVFEVSELDTFQAIVFADPQPHGNTQIDYIRDDVVTELVDADAALGITLGDIMDDNLALYPRYNRIVSSIGIPFYNVPGNHDMNYSARDDRHALETFKSIFGPNYYAFEYGDVHFIAMDNITWENPPGEEGAYTEKVGPAQLEWLSNHLRHVPEDRLVVIAGHAPWVSLEGQSPGVNVEGTSALLNTLEGRENLLMLAGHYHMVERILIDEQFGWQGSKPVEHIACAAVSGSWWFGPKDERGIPIADQRDGAPNGYHIFRFEGSSYSQRFKAAYRHDNFQMRISSPRGKPTVEELSKSAIVVNVFNGREDWSVEYQWDSEPFQPMTHKIMKDPYTVRTYTEFLSFADAWVDPKYSLHIWTAPIPAGVEPGVHVITVRTIDEHGSRQTASRIIEVR